MELGAQLKDLRKRLGWPMKKAAAWYGCSISAWHNMERGQSNIKCSRCIHQIKLIRNPPEEEIIYPHLQLTAEHLKAFRKRFGFSQERAAWFVNTKTHTWANWENDRAAIPPVLTHIIKDITRALKTDVATAWRKIDWSEYKAEFAERCEWEYLQEKD